MDKVLFFGSLVCVALLFLQFFRFVKEKRRQAKLKKVRDQIENVYLVQRSEGGDAPDVGSMEEFVVFVEYGKMEEAVAEWSSMMVESGNRLWENPEVKKVVWVKIVKFFFRDGENVNEDFWEYGERVEWEIRADRAKRHGDLKKYNSGWYEFAWHKENVVEWTNPE